MVLIIGLKTPVPLGIGAPDQHLRTVHFVSTFATSLFLEKYKAAILRVMMKCRGKEGTNDNWQCRDEIKLGPSPPWNTLQSNTFRVTKGVPRGTSAKLCSRNSAKKNK